MRITPKTEDEIATENLIADGVYPFEVVGASDKVSKAGNDMIEAKIAVDAGDGDNPRIVFDYLMEAMSYKLRHFFDAIGKIEVYESGEFAAADCLGGAGKCKIGMQPAQNGYPPKNVIKDYVKRGDEAQTSASTPAAAKRAAKTSDIADDQIPW